MPGAGRDGGDRGAGGPGGPGGVRGDALPGIDKVQAACESAQQNPAEENAFRQLRLNQWVKQTSTYVGVYTEELYNLLLRNAREAREIRKSLRSI